MKRTLGTGEHSAASLIAEGALPAQGGALDATLAPLLALAQRRQLQLRELPYLWLRPPAGARVRALRPRARALRSSVSPTRASVLSSSVLFDTSLKFKPVLPLTYCLFTRVPRARRPRHVSGVALRCKVVASISSRKGIVTLSTRAVQLLQRTLIGIVT